MTKQEVLNAVEMFSENFPREALEEIRADREKFIPELLESLVYAYDNAKALCDDESNYYLHIYAMYLLAEFREKRAFPLLLNLLKLPENEIDYLLGDGLTEGFSQLLFCVFDPESIHMMFDVIENQELYEWARAAAMGAYTMLLNEGIITKDDGISYLRNLIYEKLPSDDSEIVFTKIAENVIDAKLMDMIPDVQFLYKNNRIDGFVIGEYDGFIDWIFNEEESKPHYIGNAISEMEHWACFKNENNSQSKTSISDALFEKMEEYHKKEKTLVNSTKKVGRNDPCPCGSGKKYKKCCIDKKEKPVAVASLEDRYDLLKTYPKDSDLFKQMYEKEAIDIDMLVYKALHHRAIPMWVKRDFENERIGKINYLNEALTLFLDKCEREQITSFASYDERFMIHYNSGEWVSALVDLIEDNDSAEIKAIRQAAKDILEKFL